MKMFANHCATYNDEKKRNMALLLALPFPLKTK